MPKQDFNKVASNFIEITLWQGCSPVNLLHIFRTPFYNNISGELLMKVVIILCVNWYYLGNFKTFRIYSLFKR